MATLWGDAIWARLEGNGLRTLTQKESYDEGGRTIERSFNEAVHLLGGWFLALIPARPLVGPPFPLRGKGTAVDQWSEQVIDLHKPAAGKSIPIDSDQPTS